MISTCQVVKLSSLCILKHTLIYLHDVLIHDGLVGSVPEGVEGLEGLEDEEDSTSSPISIILASYNYKQICTILVMYNIP